MFICRRNSEGELYFTWHYLDELIDFLSGSVNPEAEIHLTKWNSPCPRDWYLLSRKDGDMSGAESLTLLAWNYAHYNEVFASGDRAALSFTDRSRVFLNSENRTIRIEATDRDILLEYQKVGPPVGSLSIHGYLWELPKRLVERRRQNYQGQPSGAFTPSVYRGFRKHLF
jgi:hypothetical protein